MKLFSSRQVRSLIRASVLMALGLTVGATRAQAAPITLFNTGVAANGTTLLAGASVDPHYTLVASADPSFPGPNAIVASPIAAGFWFADGPTSQWISPSANQAYPSAGSGNAPFTGSQNGTYSYRTTFDLTGLNPLTASISGGWATDNAGLDILINGVSTGQTNASYSSLTAFSINSGFVAGTNSLTFVTSNFCCDSSNPTGLRVELSGTAQASTTPPVPEPASLVLFGTGLAVAAVRRRRTRRS